MVAGGRGPRLRLVIPSFANDNPIFVTHIDNMLEDVSGTPSLPEPTPSDSRSPTDSFSSSSGGTVLDGHVDYTPSAYSPYSDIPTPTEGMALFELWLDAELLTETPASYEQTPSGFSSLASTQSPDSDVPTPTEGMALFEPWLEAETLTETPTSYEQDPPRLSIGLSGTTDSFFDSSRMGLRMFPDVFLDRLIFSASGSDSISISRQVSMILDGIEFLADEIDVPAHHSHPGQQKAPSLKEDPHLAALDKLLEHRAMAEFMEPDADLEDVDRRIEQRAHAMNLAETSLLSGLDRTLDSPIEKVETPISNDSTQMSESFDLQALLRRVEVLENMLNVRLQTSQLSPDESLVADLFDATPPNIFPGRQFAFPSGSIITGSLQSSDGSSFSVNPRTRPTIPKARNLFWNASTARLVRSPSNSIRSSDSMFHTISPISRAYDGRDVSFRDSFSFGLGSPFTASRRLLRSRLSDISPGNQNSRAFSVQDEGYESASPLIRTRTQHGESTSAGVGPSVQTPRPLVPRTLRRMVSLLENWDLTDDDSPPGDDRSWFGDGIDGEADQSRFVGSPRRISFDLPFVDPAIVALKRARPASPVPPRPAAQQPKPLLPPGLPLPPVPTVPFLGQDILTQPQQLQHGPPPLPARPAVSTARSSIHIYNKPLLDFNRNLDAMNVKSESRNDEFLRLAELTITEQLEREIALKTSLAHALNSSTTQLSETHNQIQGRLDILIRSSAFAELEGKAGAAEMITVLLDTRDSATAEFRAVMEALATSDIGTNTLAMLSQEFVKLMVALAAAWEERLDDLMDLTDGWEGANFDAALVSEVADCFDEWFMGFPDPMRVVRTHG